MLSIRLDPTITGHHVARGIEPEPSPEARRGLRRSRSPAGSRASECLRTRSIGMDDPHGFRHSGRSCVSSRSVHFDLAPCRAQISSINRSSARDNSLRSVGADSRTSYCPQRESMLVPWGSGSGVGTDRNQVVHTADNWSMRHGHKPVSCHWTPPSQEGFAVDKVE